MDRWESGGSYSSKSSVISSLEACPYSLGQRINELDIQTRFSYNHTAKFQILINLFLGFAKAVFLMEGRCAEYRRNLGKGVRMEEKSSNIQHSPEKGELTCLR